MVRVTEVIMVRWRCNTILTTLTVFLTQMLMYRARVREVRHQASFGDGKESEPENGSFGQEVCVL